MEGCDAGEVARAAVEHDAEPVDAQAARIAQLAELADLDRRRREAEAAWTALSLQGGIDNVPVEELLEVVAQIDKYSRAWEAAKRKSFSPVSGDQLPRLILEKILGLLPFTEQVLTAARVCRTWRDVCLRPSTWRGRRLVLGADSTRRDVLAVRLAPLYKELEVEESVKTSNEVFAVLRLRAEAAAGAATTAEEEDDVEEDDEDALPPGPVLPAVPSLKIKVMDKSAPAGRVASLLRHQPALLRLSLECVSEGISEEYTLEVWRSVVRLQLRELRVHWVTRTTPQGAVWHFCFQHKIVKELKLAMPLERLHVVDIDPWASCMARKLLVTSRKTLLELSVGRGDWLGTLPTNAVLPKVLRLAVCPGPQADLAPLLRACALAEELTVELRADNLLEQAAAEAVPALLGALLGEGVLPRLRLLVVRARAQQPALDHWHSDANLERRELLQAALKEVHDGRKQPLEVREDFPLLVPGEDGW